MAARRPHPNLNQHTDMMGHVPEAMMHPQQHQHQQQLQHHQLPTQQIQTQQIPTQLPTQPLSPSPVPSTSAASTGTAIKPAPASMTGSAGSLSTGPSSVSGHSRSTPDPANPPANRKNLETPLRIYEYVGLSRNSHQNQVKKLAREVYLKHPDLAADKRWSGIDRDSKRAAVEELKRACEKSVEVLQSGRVGEWFYDWLLKRVKKAKIANLAAAEKKRER